MNVRSFPNREGEHMRRASVLVALAGTFAPVEALGGSEPARSARGGLVAKTGHYRFEVYFYRTGMRVFPRRGVGTPLAVTGLAGAATFYHPNSPKPWFSRPLRAAPSASSLDLAIGLGDAPSAGVKVAVEIAGLPKPSEPTAAFTVPLEFIAGSAAGGITASAQPARPRGAVPTVSPYSYGFGHEGLGYYPFSRPVPFSRHAGGPTPSLSGYGRVPATSPETPLPYTSGHSVLILPSAGDRPASRGPDWGVPLARPWLRPMD
jgi:hypothetical protein